MVKSNAYEVVNFPTDVLTFVPGEDISSLRDCFVKVTGDGEVSALDAATDLAIGVLKNSPSPTGISNTARVQIRGVARVIAGTGGLAAGDLVTTDVNGKGVKVDQTSVYAYGICVFGASAGQLASVKLFDGPAVL